MMMTLCPSRESSRYVLGDWTAASPGTITIADGGLASSLK